MKNRSELANQFAIGVNSYPYDLANATNMIINYKNYVNKPNYPGKKKKQSKNYFLKE